MSIPFKKSLSGDSKFPIYRANVSFDDYTENASLRLVSSRLDLKKGILLLTFQNAGDEDLQFYNNFLFSENEIFTSDLYTLTPGDRLISKVYLPHVSNDKLLNKSFPVRTYFGVQDTYFSMDDTIYLKHAFLTAMVISTAWISVPVWVVIIFVILLVAAIIIWFIFKRRRKNNAPPLQKLYRKPKKVFSKNKKTTRSSSSKVTKQKLSSQRKKSS